MACREFQKKGFLYLSGEMDTGEMALFEAHLKSCPLCAGAMEEAGKTWSDLHALPRSGPSLKTRKAILDAARSNLMHPMQTGRSFRLPEWLTSRPVSFGLAAAALVMICIIILFNPLAHLGTAPKANSLLAWEDHFMSNADWIDKELERIDSGRLLANYYESSENSDDLDPDWLSTHSNDLNAIRRDVETLVQSFNEL